MGRRCHYKSGKHLLRKKNSAEIVVKTPVLVNVNSHPLGKRGLVSVKEEGSER